MLRLQIITGLLFCALLSKAQEHPVAFFSKADAAVVKMNIDKYPLIKTSFQELKKQVDAYVGKDVDVPVPKDPAGGYTHDKHKSNYMLMFNSGILYNLTGDKKYAELTKLMLLKYAALNPTLKNHPEATSSSPGRIFWQALNDANWMVYTGMAYDLVYHSLTASERKTIELGAFKPEVDFITKDLQSWFDLLHNHAVWACAGVGIIGIATNNKDYVDMALYGSYKDGKRGFLAQLDNLFSPDGYYTEGPYYERYAILPFALFANAINNTNPSLKIFERRNRILQKALNTCLQLTNTDGMFLPLNDAIKDKDYTTNELVTAIDIFWNAYGADINLLPIVKKQNKVLLNKGGLEIAIAMDKNKNAPAYYAYKTFESKDGVDGKEGGVSVLRNGKNADITSLIFKYTSHGLSHGHFDKLNINLFDRGNEILQDYGSVRFVGVEQKYGGRYLPENTKYAAQTIAHNTIVVDEKSHFDGRISESEKFHSEKLFSNFTNPSALVIAAKEDNAYKNVQMQRNLYMLQLPGFEKIVVDIFNVNAADVHQYDLPFHFAGQFIDASFKYQSHTTKQEPLGTKNGYQYLWKEAEAKVYDSTTRFTFLNDKVYYTVSSYQKDTANVFFTRLGANDPNFNLRRDPACIIRKKGKDVSFVNVIEIHGKFDTVNEYSINAYPSVQNIKLLRSDDAITVAEITIAGKKLLIAQCNKDFSTSSNHSFIEAGVSLNWVGPYTILFDGKSIN